MYDGRIFGIELLVWKVCADHQQDFAIHYGDVAGRESEKPGHADVEGIVILNKLLATQSMHDGSLQLAGQFDQFVMSSGATRTAQNSDLVRPVQEVRKQVEFFGRRTNGWCGFLKV